MAWLPPSASPASSVAVSERSDAAGRHSATVRRPALTPPLVDHAERPHLVIADEFSDWEDSRRRIDLLAIDRNANLVVIELKRDEVGAR